MWQTRVVAHRRVANRDEAIMPAKPSPEPSASPRPFPNPSPWDSLKPLMLRWNVTPS